MSEEPPNRYEPADIYKQQTYRVIISGDNIVIPIDAFIELPKHLADLFIEASQETTPTAGQQALKEELTTHLNKQFPELAEGGFSIDNVDIEPLSDEEE